MIGLQFISPDRRNQKLCLQTNLAVPAVAIGIAMITGLTGTGCGATNHDGPRQTTSDRTPPLTTETSTLTPPPVTTGPTPYMRTAPPVAGATQPKPMRPNGGSGVILESKSRNLMCQVLDDSVACVGRFTDPQTGVQYNLVSVNALGNLHYGGGDMDEIDVAVRLNYQTYHALDRTIVADKDAMTFINDQTRHGMRTNPRVANGF